MDLKKIIKKELKRVLLEAKGDKHSYGCAMLFFDIPKKEWDKVQSLIKEEDLYIEDGDKGFGREDEPHVTLLYGLHDTISDKEIEEVSKEMDIIDLKLKKISIFDKNEKYDVVKFDIVGDSKKKLEVMNKKYSEFPHTTNFPDYHPHTTIAYVKAGKGKDYIQTLKEEDTISVTPTEVAYSKSSGEVIKYKLK